MKRNFLTLKMYGLFKLAFETKDILIAESEKNKVPNMNLFASYAF